jgi:hypothetical protein
MPAGLQAGRDKHKGRPLVAGSDELCRNRGRVAQRIERVDDAETGVVPLPRGAKLANRRRRAAGNASCQNGSAKNTKAKGRHRENWFGALVEYLPDGTASVE